MTWTLPWLLALLVGMGDPDFDPETGCLDPHMASSPMCVQGPWAEILPTEAAIRAHWLGLLAGVLRATGDERAAGEAEAAAEEALELALTDRDFATAWLSSARRTLAALREGGARRIGSRAPAAWDPPDEEQAPAAAREALANARDSLR